MGMSFEQAQKIVNETESFERTMKAKKEAFAKEPYSTQRYEDYMEFVRAQREYLARRIEQIMNMNPEKV